MLSTGSAGLVVAYVFVALLLLGLNLYSRWHRVVKAAVTLATVAFCLLTWLSIPELLGWPVAESPPQKFRLHAAHIQQPDKVSKHKGTINLWLTDVRNLAQGGVPRAYALPYSAPLHEIVLNAMGKMVKGVPQMGEFKVSGGSKISGLDDPAHAAQTSAPIAFYDIPDPLFPDK